MQIGQIFEQYISYCQACEKRDLKPVTFQQHAGPELTYSNYEEWCFNLELQPANGEVYNRVNAGAITEQ